MTEPRSDEYLIEVNRRSGLNLLDYLFGVIWKVKVFTPGKPQLRGLRHYVDTAYAATERGAWAKGERIARKDATESQKPVVPQNPIEARGYSPW